MSAGAILLAPAGIAGLGVLLFCLFAGVASLAAVSFRLAREEIRRYRTEQAAIRDLRARLQSALEAAGRQRTAEAGAGSEDAEGSTRRRTKEEARLLPFGDLAALAHGLPPDSFTLSRVDYLERMRRLRVRVSPEALQEQTRLHRASSSNLPLLLLSSVACALLGLLASTVSLLPPGDSSLAGALVSALGIGCALYAAVEGFLVHQASARFASSLESFTARDLLPAAVPSLEDESALERISLQLEAATGRLDQTFQRSEEVLSRIRASQQAFVEIVDGIRTLTRADAVRQMDKVIELLTRGQETTAGLIERLGGLTRDLTETQARLADEHGKMADSHRRLGGQLETLKRWWGAALAAVVGAALLMLIGGC